MKKNLIFIFLALLIGLSSCQNGAGSALPHVYTWKYRAENFDKSVNGLLSFQFSVNGVFTPTEDVFRATAIVDFGYTGKRSVNSNDMVTMLVQKTELIDSQNIFRFTVRVRGDFALPFTPASNNNRQSMRPQHITYNIILVGELLDGPQQPGMSPVWVSNSQYTTGLSVNTRQYLVKFNSPVQGNPGQSRTPFLKFPDSQSSLNQIRCGARKNGNNYFLAFTDCEQASATVFITGVQFAAPDDTVTAPSTVPDLADQQIVLKRTPQDSKFPQNKGPNEREDSAGLLVRMQFTQKVVVIQISTIVVMFQTYTAAYPKDNTLLDINSYITTELVGDQTSNAPYRTASSDGVMPFYDNQPSGFADDKYAHRFCGMSQHSHALGYVLGNSPAPTANDIYSFTTQFKLAQTKIETTVSPVRTGSNDNGIKNIFNAFSCIFLRSQTPCQETAIEVQLTGIGTLEKTGGADAFLSSTTTNYYTSNQAGTNVLNQGVVTGIATQSFSSEGKVTYVFTVDQANVKSGIYEGVLYISGGAPSTNNLNQIVTITIFGQTIVYDKSLISTTKLYQFAFQVLNPTDNKVTISYQVEKPITTSTINVPTQNVQFGLVYHKNVVGGSTSTTSTIAGATACSNLCTPATSTIDVGVDYSTKPPKCITCSKSVNQAFIPETGKCGCAMGFFSSPAIANDIKCQPCPTLCAKCQNPTVCSQCVPNAAFPSTTNTQTCQCLPGYFQQAGRCVKCGAGCETCNTAGGCLKCIANQGTRGSQALGCPCIDGFYQTGQPVCARCSSVCETCVDDKTCKTCKQGLTQNPTDKSCSCPIGRYLAIVGTKAECLPCHFSCKSCFADASKCIECKTDLWKKDQNGYCFCDKQMRVIQIGGVTDGVCLDKNCTELDPNCVQCGVLSQNAQLICRRCDYLRNFTISPDNKSCVCRAGFFLKNGQCAPCGAGCQTCTSQKVCSICSQGSNDNRDGTCSCGPGLYLQTKDNNLFCLSCNPNCGECQIRPDICTRCTNGFLTIENKCVCPIGRYATPDNVNCLPCMPGCKACTNGTTCLSCGSGFLSSGDNKCIMDCPLGTYNTQNVKCQGCSPGCRKCISPINCQSCQSGFYLYYGRCSEICPDGTFGMPGTGMCIACDAACDTCSISRNNCTACSANFVLNNGQCIQGCPAGFFYGGERCERCSPNCANCSGTPNTCISCIQGQYLVKGTCSPTCPTQIVNGVCINFCPEGTFPSGTTCQKCSAQCKTCSALNNCTSCNGNLLAYRGNCISTCPQNTIASSGVCLDCDSSCIGCAQSTVACLQCRPGFYRLTNRCYNRCPTGTYPEMSTMSCRSCDTNCINCLGPNQCNVCSGNTQPVQGVCSNNCGPNCLQCQGSTCTRCAPSFYWSPPSCVPACPPGAEPSRGICVCKSGFLNLGVCVSNCAPGFINVNNECRTCQSPCKTCTGSIDACVTCLDGYEFDPVNKKCNQRSNCPFGQYFSSFKQCRFICDERNYFLESACYVQRCPPGFSADNQKRICTKRSAPAGCSAPLFLQGQVCAATCDQGFYPNTQNRVCIPCAPNCLTCQGPNSCSSCGPGTILQNNVCVQLTDSCPPNQFRFNQGCVSSCPFGTINKDGFCIRQCNAGSYYYNAGCYQECPTNLFTAHACVVVCPVGHSKNGNRCVAITTSCRPDQFLNPTTGFCENCRYPCTSCSGVSTFCISCANGFSLRSNGACVSDNSCQPGSYSTQNGCQRCPAKCSTCLDQRTCTSCANGYTNTGADCVLGSVSLQSVRLQLVSISRRQLVVFIQIQSNILPNGLPSSLISQLLLFVPNNPGVANQVNIWINNGYIYVAVSHNRVIPSYDAALILNSGVFDDIYKSMGYTTANSFVQVSISPNVGVADATVQIPATAFAAMATSQKMLALKYNSRLNSQAINSLKLNQRIG